MKKEIRERFDQAVSVIRLTEEHLAGRILQAVEMIVGCFKSGQTVLLFGNGGSAADAQHFACELVGRFLADRPAFRAIALTTDSSVMTSVGNDYGFEQVFARQIEALASPGDVAIALSTSGNSPNVVAALNKARELGAKTIAMTGCGGGKCAELADLLLDVPCSDSCPRIQEAHAVIYHVICEFVEQSLLKK